MADDWKAHLKPDERVQWDELDARQKADRVLRHRIWDRCRKRMKKAEAAK